MFDFVYLIPIILGPASLATVAIIAFIVVRAKQRKLELQAEVQSKLIDKFGSAPELLTFLKSEEGRKFLGEIESGPRLSARDRIIRGMGKALTTGLLGVGFLIIGFIPITQNEFCIVVGFLLFALGVGLLLSALLALKLSRSWGLMEQEPSSSNA